METRVMFVEWMHGCESLSREFPYEEILERIKIDTEFYTDPDVFLHDVNLFADICPIPIVHCIACYWSLFPGVCYYSYEQRLLFFVLDAYLKKSRENESKRPLVLIRMMEIANFYHGCKQPLTLVSIPDYAKNMLAVMDYSNLSLIPDHVPLITIHGQSIKDRFGFDTIVQQNLLPGKTPLTNTSLFLVTELAKSNAVQRYTDFLMELQKDPTYEASYFKQSVLII